MRRYYRCPDLRFAASSFAAASIRLPAAWKAAFSCGARQHGMSNQPRSRRGEDAGSFLRARVGADLFTAERWEETPFTERGRPWGVTPGGTISSDLVRSRQISSNLVRSRQISVHLLNVVDQRQHRPERELRLEHRHRHLKKQREGRRCAFFFWLDLSIGTPTFASAACSVAPKDRATCSVHAPMAGCGCEDTV